MENNHLTFDNFKIAAHNKVDAIVQGYKNFGNTTDFLNLRDKIGDQQAEDIWKIMQKVSYDEQYEHAMRISYDNYLIGMFKLD